MTALSPVPAPPTAQEALAALRTLSDYAIPFDEQVLARGPVELPMGAQAAHDELKASIESAAAEADAWAKIEAWCEGKPPDTAASVWREGVVWSCAVYNSDNDYEAYKNRWDAPTRLAALQLAAAWCEKEGA